MVDTAEAVNHFSSGSTFKIWRQKTKSHLEQSMSLLIDPTCSLEEWKKAVTDAMLED